MKHLIGPFYFKKPCSIGIYVGNQKLANVLNVVGAILTISIIALLIYRAVA